MRTGISALAISIALTGLAGSASYRLGAQTFGQMIAQ
jgi:hypothetical protein